MTTRYELARSPSSTSRIAAPGCNGRRTVRHALGACRLVPRDRPARDGGEAGHWAFARAPLLAVQAETVGFVIGAPLRHVHLHLPVTLEIHYRTFRRVDRQLMEVRGAANGFELPGSITSMSFKF